MVFSYLLSDNAMEIQALASALVKSVENDFYLPLEWEPQEWSLAELCMLLEKQG